jgi:hypothetical protein
VLALELVEEVHHQIRHRGKISPPAITTSSFNLKHFPPVNDDYTPQPALRIDWQLTTASGALGLSITNTRGSGRLHLRPRSRPRTAEQKRRCPRVTDSMEVCNPISIPPPQSKSQSDCELDNSTTPMCWKQAFNPTDSLPTLPHQHFPFVSCKTPC